MHDHDIICRGMHVQLDRIRPELECALERGKGILGSLAIGSAMRNELRAMPRDVRRHASDFFGAIQSFSLNTLRRNSRSSAVGSTLVTYAL